MEKLHFALEAKASARKAVVVEARQKAVADFKQSEEYTLSTQDCDAVYNKGIEEIFYNIWRKHRGVYYKFLGKEYRNQIAIWDKQSGMAYSTLNLLLLQSIPIMTAKFLGIVSPTTLIHKIPLLMPDLSVYCILFFIV